MSETIRVHLGFGLRGKDHSLGQDQPLDADKNIWHFSGLSRIASQGSSADPRKILARAAKVPGCPPVVNLLTMGALGMAAAW